MQIAPPPDVSGIANLWPMLKDILEIVIIPYLAWNYKINKEMNAKLDTHRESLSKRLDEINSDVRIVNTTLVGQDGKNGLRSRFNSLEESVRELSLGMARSGIDFRAPTTRKVE